MTRRNFLIHLRNAVIGFVLGLIIAFFLPIGMAIWLWSESDE